MGDILSSIGGFSGPKTKGSDKQRRLLADLYDRHVQELKIYISRKFGDGPPEPEDVVQTAFAKLASLDIQQDVRNPRAFLYATARNIVSDHHRRQRTASAYADDASYRAAEEILYDLSPERVLMSKEQFRSLMAALQSLTNKQRRLILFNRFYGLSYAEIAGRTSMSPEAVRKHIERGLARLMEVTGGPQSDSRGDRR